MMNADRERTPRFFELQVKTLFQHAWSEASHDIAYKPDVPLSSLAETTDCLHGSSSLGQTKYFPNSILN